MQDAALQFPAPPRIEAASPPRFQADDPRQALVVGHWPGGGLDAGAPGDVLRVSTCLRELLIGVGPGAMRAIAALSPPEPLTGPAAYEFLLAFATGLKSAVPGETNVFGQFRRAWEAHRRAAGPAAAAGLAPLVAAVMRDARAVREAYLQNIGGASYGALVRRLLRPAPGEPVLFVGAGDLARSMLPFFRAWPTGVWSRRPPGPAFAAAAQPFAPGDGARAAAWARHVIFTTPADPDNDRRWRGWLAAGDRPGVVHLGHRREAGPGWHAVARWHDLDDVFDLRHAQDNVRSLQLRRAALACRDLAERPAAPSRLAGRRRAAG